ncbi:MAG: Uma2 family endonuclease [Bacteroidia bacterium]|nr:Uma2 family endonuclease [Bacteroidia bacterium]
MHFIPTTLETYLAMEAGSDTRYEYYDGLIVAMAVGSPRHSKIAMNIGAALHAALRASGKSCDVFTSDAKVSIRPGGIRVYPDVSVVCGPVEPDPHEPRAMTNPVLIVDVLSEATELHDRSTKFAAYRQLTTLHEYVLVSQDKALVEVFSRTPEGIWQFQVVTGAGTVRLPGLEMSLPLSDVYYRVDFTETSVS